VGQTAVVFEVPQELLRVELLDELLEHELLPGLLVLDDGDLGTAVEVGDEATDKPVLAVERRRPLGFR
jgi:hypothetical protein